MNFHEWSGQEGLIDVETCIDGSSKQSARMLVAIY